MRRKNNCNDKQHQKIIKRRQPVVDREVDFTMAINYSPPVRKEKTQIKGSKPFNEVPTKSYPLLFVKKCEECYHVFDFQMYNLYQKQIDIKSTLLLQIISGFDNKYLDNSVGPKHFNIFLEMIRRNIFRAFPNIMLKDCDVNYLSWPHLKLVYCCLKKSLFFNFYKNISTNFLYNLLKNTASYDKRERICASDIVYELYLRHENLRPAICKCISNLLSINTLSNELLQLINSIYVKANASLNTDFFIEYILPIHLSEKSMLYQSLLECDLSFTRRDPNLFPFIFQYLLNHWPITNLKKYSFFLKIIVKLFELTLIDNRRKENSVEITPEMANAFFDAVSLCSCSEYADVASYALLIINTPIINDVYKISTCIHRNEYNDEYDNNYLEESNNCTFLKIYQSVILAENHWDDTVRSLALDAKLALSNLDPMKFKKNCKKLANKKGDIKNAPNRIDERWNIILRQAKKRYKTIKLIVQ